MCCGANDASWLVRRLPGTLLRTPQEEKNHNIHTLQSCLPHLFAFVLNLLFARGLSPVTSAISLPASGSSSPCLHAVSSHPDQSPGPLRLRTCLQGVHVMSAFFGLIKGCLCDLRFLLDPLLWPNFFKPRFSFSSSRWLWRKAWQLRRPRAHLSHPLSQQEGTVTGVFRRKCSTWGLRSTST